MFRFLRRLKQLSHINAEKGSDFFFAPNVELYCEPGAQIILTKAKLRVGLPLDEAVRFSTKAKTVVFLRRNARLVLEGNVVIAPGTTIYVNEGAELRFKGENVVAHDSLIFCNSKIEIGRGTSFSWCVTLMDSDLHVFYRSDGSELRKIRRPLLIGENVGIQMNVVVPSGICIGNGSIISANTVLRQDIPANSLAYSDVKVKIHSDVTTGFSRIKQDGQ